jgi:competence protein ComEA
MRPLMGLVIAILVLLWTSGARAAPRAAEPRLAEPRVVEPRVAVYVSGAVRRPGVYRLPPGTRVADAIQAAGGTAKGAALAELDLASPVGDGDTVRVPLAAANMPGSRPIVPMAESFDPRKADTTRRSVRRRAHGGASGRRGRASARHMGRQVDLNRARPAELQQLPGVGPGLAGRIVAYRRRVGRIGKVEELREVPGIGDRRLARIAPHATVR